MESTGVDVLKLDEIGKNGRQKSLRRSKSEDRN